MALTIQTEDEVICHMTGTVNEHYGHRVLLSVHVKRHSAAVLPLLCDRTMPADPSEAALLRIINKSTVVVVVVAAIILHTRHVKRVTTGLRLLLLSLALQPSCPLNPLLCWAGVMLCLYPRDQCSLRSEGASQLAQHEDLSVCY